MSLVKHSFDVVSGLFSIFLFRLLPFISLRLFRSILSTWSSKFVVYILGVLLIALLCTSFLPSSLYSSAVFDEVESFPSILSINFGFASSQSLLIVSFGPHLPQGNVPILIYSVS